MKKLFYLLLTSFLSLKGSAQLSLTATSGTLSGTYPTVKSAFDAINSGTHQGTIFLYLNANSVETASAALNASGSGSASYTRIVLMPTVNGLSITGNIAAPLINLNGATNFVIDGRVNGTGAVKSLLIENTSSSTVGGTSTIQLINGASYDSIEFCILKGASLTTVSPYGGILLINTSTAATGNNGNVIDHCDFTGSTAGRPIYSVFSVGTAGKNNTSNVISNCRFFDVLNTANTSYGLFLGPANSAWRIEGNHFYESTAWSPTVGGNSITFIGVNATAGNGFSIINNYIGGSSENCGSLGSVSALTKNTIFAQGFTGIYLNTAGGTASEISGNVIKNISWTNTSGGAYSCYGISVAGVGDVNIGVGGGNMIGDTVGNASILFSAYAASSSFYGMYITTTGTSTISNNAIGGISTNSNVATNSNNLYALYRSGAAGGSITGNLIGSRDPGTVNSLYAMSAATGNSQQVYGITSGSSVNTIQDNVVSSLTNATTNNTTSTMSYLSGIVANSGTVNVSGNTVCRLKSSSKYTGAASFEAVAGIVMSSTTNTAHTVTGNVIYDLQSNAATFSGNVVGLIYNGPVTSGTVSKNQITDIRLTYELGKIYGLRFATGSAVFANNLIVLNDTIGATVYGINATGGSGYTCNLYHNTVVIRGQKIATAYYKTYAIYVTATAGTMNILNNIFDNRRSTLTGSGSMHYAVYLVGTAGITSINNNNYFVKGLQSVLGYNAGDKVSIPLVTGMDNNSMMHNPAFYNSTGNLISDFLPSAKSLVGAAGSGILTDINGSTRSLGLPAMGVLEYSVSNEVITVNSSGGTTTATYSRLKNAMDAINTGTHQGDIVVKVNDNSCEYATSTLYQSGYGGVSNYTSVLMYPTADSISVFGNFAGPLIDLNGAKNVIIDGRINGAGTSRSLTINNVSISNADNNCTFRFINDASDNTIRYAILRGASTAVSSYGNYWGGIVYFSSTTGTTGNDNNSILHNQISGSDSLNRAVVSISSQGTAGKENSGLLIKGNEFIDFLFRGNSGASAPAARGVYLYNYTTQSVVDSNSFCETIPFVPVYNASQRVAHVIISVDYYQVQQQAGNGMIISNNVIGGSGSWGTGMWNKTNSDINQFTGISIRAGMVSPSFITNNSIKNINYTQSSVVVTNNYFRGINGYGGVVFINGNQIGDMTTNGSITVNAAMNSIVNGIIWDNVLATDTAYISDNRIGSVSNTNLYASYYCNFYGIYKGSVGGYTEIKRNIIGSSSTANSINVSHTATSAIQQVYGIYSIGVGVTNVYDNIIQNLTNGTSNTNVATAGLINGIYIGGGKDTVLRNKVMGLRISNLNTLSTYQLSAGGIVINNTGAGGTMLISKNEVSDIVNDNATFGGHIAGLFYGGSTSLSSVNANLITGLYATGVSSVNANIYGVKISSGVTKYSNNIISLGGTSLSNLYGIYETGAASNNNSLYFNSVSIHGNVNSGSNMSYAFFGNASTNTRDFRNNIFKNSRSTTGGASLHYALYLNYGVSSILTLNNNLYFVSGTAGVLGRYNSADVLSLPIVAGADAGSFNADPLFYTPNGTMATDYYTNSNYLGFSGTGINYDYSGATRSATPRIGAWDSNPPLLAVQWQQFGGLLRGKSVFLEWTIGNSEIGAVYELQRSYNGRDYEQIYSFCSAEGGEKRGSFTDVYTGNGYVYYRIYHINSSNEKEISKVLFFIVQKPEREFTLFPNPCTDELTIKTNYLDNGNYQGIIYSLSGEVLLRFSVKESITKIDLCKLVSGLYIVKIGDMKPVKLIKISR